MVNTLKRPSSTITAATLAGMAMAVLWGTLNEFFGVAISPEYVSLTTTFVSAFVGYIKRENVLPVQRTIDTVTK